MDKEMEEIEEVLDKINADPKMRDVVAPESIYDNLMAQIRADKEKKERLSKEEKELIRLGNIYKKRRGWNKIFVLAVAVVCALAVCVTSMGGPAKVIEKVQGMVKGKEQIHVDTEDNRTTEILSVSEVEAYQQIEDEFGFYPVKLYYLPEGMAFQEVELDVIMQKILMIYMHQDGGVISYTMYSNYRTGSLAVDVEDELLNEYEKEISDVVISVKEYLVAENQSSRYVVTYEYQDVYYYLQLMNIEQSEVNKIIENLYFS